MGVHRIARVGVVAWRRIVRFFSNTCRVAKSSSELHFSHWCPFHGRIKAVIVTSSVSIGPRTWGVLSRQVFWSLNRCSKRCVKACLAQTKLLQRVFTHILGPGFAWCSRAAFRPIQGFYMHRDLRDCLCNACVVQGTGHSHLARAP